MIIDANIPSGLMIFFLYKSIMIMDGLNLQYLNNFSLLFWKIDKLSFTKSKSFKIIVRKQGSCSMSMEKNEWVNWNFCNSVFYQLNNSIKKSEKAYKRKYTYFRPTLRLLGLRSTFFKCAKNNSQGAASYEWGAEYMIWNPRTISSSCVCLLIWYDAPSS